MPHGRTALIAVVVALGLAGAFAFYASIERDVAIEIGDAQTIDWSDLIPPAQDDGGVKLRDGSLARGIVGHGALAPKDGGAASDSTGSPALSPHEIATLLGAVNSLDAPPRRLADVSGGIGNLRGLQPRGGAVRPELDGMKVRIAGFVAPLAFDGSKISEFLLVPYAGACIHVPPPPANQIVHISDFGGYRADGGLLYPVWVIGTLRAAPLETDLANVGYRIEGGRVSRYE